MKHSHPTGLFKYFKDPEGSETLCESAMLKIGYYRDVDHRDGSFDLDDLYIFPEPLSHDLIFKIISRFLAKLKLYFCAVNIRKL